MNNKSRLLSSFAFICAVMGMVACNQGNSYDVSFTGENCVAKCSQQTTASSLFTFKGEKNSEITMTVEPNATYALGNLTMKIGNRDAVAGQDYYYTSIEGSLNKKLNFVVSDNIKIVVTANAATNLAVKAGKGDGYTFTSEKASFSGGETVNLSLTILDGYYLPATISEVKDIIHLTGSVSGINYDYDIDLATNKITFVMPAENILVNGSALKFAYLVTDNSYGCLLDIGGLSIECHTLVTANIIVLPGFAEPISEECIYIMTSEGERIRPTSYVGGSTPSFSFMMPVDDVTITAYAKSHEVGVYLVPGSEGVNLAISGDSFHRGDHVSARAYAKEGYILDEHTIVEIAYIGTSGQGGIIEEFNWLPESGDLSFDIPNPESLIVGDFNVCITIKANKIPHSINVNVDNVSADHIIITANGEERDPAYYYINDEIEITLTTNPNYQLPAYKGEFNFTNIDQSDVTYIVEEVAEDFTQTGTLTFTMPAKDVAISATTIEKYSALPFSHTSVTSSNISLNGTSFAPGSLVTGTIIPDINHVIPERARAIFFFDSNDLNHATPITDVPVTYDPAEGGTFSFIMPRQNVYVGAICHESGPMTIATYCANERSPASVSGVFGQTVSVTFDMVNPGYHIAADMSEFLSTHYVIGDYIDSDLSYDFDSSQNTGKLTISPVRSGLYIIGSAPIDNP